MNKYSPDDLIKAGYKPEIFFYKIGGGEDESDMTIYVKDDIAVRIQYNSSTYPSGVCYAVKCDYLSTQNGWDYYNENMLEL